MLAGAVDRSGVFGSARARGSLGGGGGWGL